MIDRDGNRVFVTNYDGSIAVINTENHSIHTFPASGIQTWWSAPTAHSSSLPTTQTVGDNFDSVISVMDSSGATVATLHGVDDVTALAISPDGTRLYLAGCDRGSYYQYPAGWLTIIDTATYTAINTIAVGACPDAVTVSPDGAHLYITHYDDNDSVSAVDLTNNGVSTIDLGDQPLRVAP